MQESHWASKNNTKKPVETARAALVEELFQLSDIRGMFNMPL